MRPILFFFLSLVAGFGQRISDLTNTNVAVGTNLLPIVVAPGVAGGTRNIAVANLFSNQTHFGNTAFPTNGVTLSGTNTISGCVALTNMGAHFFTDGTNLIVVFQNAAGTRTTNKLSKASWP